MIFVRITMKALPENQKEVTLTLLSLVEEVGREQGCHGFTVYRDLEDSLVFVLLAEWGTRDDLDRHLMSDRFSVLLGTRSLLCRPVELKIHTVTHSEGAEILTVLRGRANPNEIH
jgi:quinol monooxygenase YgiN